MFSKLCVGCDIITVLTDSLWNKWPPFADNCFWTLSIYEEILEEHQSYIKISSLALNLIEDILLDCRMFVCTMEAAAEPFEMDNTQNELNTSAE